MEGKFDAYVVWPLAKRVQNWIVDRSTARDFTVYGFSSFKLQNWGQTNVLGLKRDDELTYNRHVTHYCFASLRVSDFVFFLDTQKWLDFESHYIHIVLCVGRGTAALLSLNFLYFVPSIEYIWNVNCPLKYFLNFEIFIFFTVF